MVPEPWPSSWWTERAREPVYSGHPHAVRGTWDHSKKAARGDQRLDLHLTTRHPAPGAAQGGA